MTWAFINADIAVDQLVIGLIGNWFYRVSNLKKVWINVRILGMKKMFFGGNVSEIGESSRGRLIKIQLY